jgi:hypothetical protein
MTNFENFCIFWKNKEKHEEKMRKNDQLSRKWQCFPEDVSFFWTCFVILRFFAMVLSFFVFWVIFGSFFDVLLVFLPFCRFQHFFGKLTSLALYQNDKNMTQKKLKIRNDEKMAWKNDMTKTMTKNDKKNDKEK